MTEDGVGLYAFDGQWWPSGMGEVSFAHDTKLDRGAALKLLTGRAHEATPLRVVPAVG